MQTLSILFALVGAGGGLLAARMLAAAQSPAGAYLAAASGLAAVGALCLSLLIIWL